MWGTKVSEIERDQIPGFLKAHAGSVAFDRKLIFKKLKAESDSETRPQ